MRYGQKHILQGVAGFTFIVSDIGAILHVDIKFQENR